MSLIVRQFSPHTFNHSLFIMLNLFIIQHEYMSYMEKKTNRRQTTIVSLSDQNQKEIQDIRDQKQQMLEAYEEKKQG